MNEYDSGRMRELMETEGYVHTDNQDDADLVVLNTCHIREKATEKVYSELVRIRHHDDMNGKKRIIAVAGCVAQAEGKEIFKRAKNLDMVFGPQSYHKLPEYTAEALKGKKGYEATKLLAIILYGSGKSSYRYLEKLFNVCPATIMNWIKSFVEKRLMLLNQMRLLLRLK